MIKILFYAGLLLASSVCSASFNEKLEVSGFARIVAGYFDSDDQLLRGYTNSLGLKQDSLIALRADYALTDTLSFTVQGLATPSEVRESSIQWLYADYRPSRDWSIKFGRQRIPFFQYSDVVDVGFAYPWVTLPIPVHSGAVFTEFDGALIRHDFSLGAVYGHAELYSGTYNGDIVNYSESIRADVDDIFGTVLSLGYHNFSVRASYHQGHVSVVQERLVQFIATLYAFGFNESARTLEIDDMVSIAQLGFTYENLNYFIRGEYTDIASDDYLIGERKAAYVTAGINHNKMTYHLTYSYGKLQDDEPAHELMFGASEQLDQLTFGYQQAITNTGNDDRTILSIGTRYDYSQNIAFKSEVFFVDREKALPSFIPTIPGTVDQSSDVLYQLAMEWVF